MAKDIIIPKMYCQLRDTLLQSGWIISHSDVNDTYIVLIPTRRDDILHSALYA